MVIILASDIPSDLQRFFQPVNTGDMKDAFTLSPSASEEEHFATYPKNLVRPCVRAGCPVDGVVLDPFVGSGTAGVVAIEEGRKFVGIDASEEYIRNMAIPRLASAKKGITVNEERSGQGVLF